MKNSIVQDLTAQRDEIVAAGDALSEAERTTAITPEGWNAQDFVGHLSFWEQHTLKHIDETIQHGRPTPMPLESLDDDINAEARNQRADWNWQRIRAEFIETRNALIQRIDALSESDLEIQLPSPWVKDVRIISLEALIREDVLGHGQEHLAELKRWRQDHG